MESLVSFIKVYRNYLIAGGVLVAILLVLHFTGVAADFVNTWQENRQLKKMHAEQTQKLVEAEAKVKAADEFFQAYSLQKGDANAFKPLLEKIAAQLSSIEAEQKALNEKVDANAKQVLETGDAYRDAMRQLNGGQRPN